jgi:hypothetical protein
LKKLCLWLFLDDLLGVKIELLMPLFMGRWHFLVFVSVCQRCPCAGRQLLFFAAAKKSNQKKAAHTASVTPSTSILLAEW